MKDVQCYEFFGGIALKNHAFSFSFHFIKLVIVRPDEDIHKNLLLQTHLNQTIIALNPTSMLQSLSLLPYTGLLGTLLTLTAHPLLLKFPVFQRFHLLKRQTSSVTFCALY